MLSVTKVSWLLFSISAFPPWRQSYFAVAFLFRDAEPEKLHRHVPTLLHRVLIHLSIATPAPHACHGQKENSKGAQAKGHVLGEVH